MALCATCKALRMVARLAVNAIVRLSGSDKTVVNLIRSPAQSSRRIEMVTMGRLQYVVPPV